MTAAADAVNAENVSAGASNAVVAALAQDTSNDAPLRPPGVLVAELPGQSRL